MTTQYGEIVFDENGYAAGAIWIPSCTKRTLTQNWRVKSFTRRPGESNTTLVNSREEAIEWLSKQGLPSVEKPKTTLQVFEGPTNYYVALEASTSSLVALKYFVEGSEVLYTNGPSWFSSREEAEAAVAKSKSFVIDPDSRESLHIYELGDINRVGDHGNFYVAGVGSRDQMYFRKGEGSLYPYTPTWFYTKEEARIAVECTGKFKVDNPITPPPVKILLHIKGEPRVYDVEETPLGFYVALPDSSYEVDRYYKAGSPKLRDSDPTWFKTESEARESVLATGCFEVENAN